jgi:hypothetical protein
MFSYILLNQRQSPQITQDALKKKADALESEASPIHHWGDTSPLPAGDKSCHKGQGTENLG